MTFTFDTEPDSLVFDLDGTLWETTDAVVIGWNNVLRRHGIDWPTVTAEQVRSVTGQPHADCIRSVFVGLPETQLRLLIEDTQVEDNRLIAELGGELYPGVAEGLPRLADRYPLFIVSNCQSGYIETFLAQTGMHDLFRDFECWGNTGESKGANLGFVIERNRLASPVFTGDGAGDREAARANRVPFIHARWGFSELADEFGADSFGELCHALLELRDKP